MTIGRMIRRALNMLFVILLVYLVATATIWWGMYHVDQVASSIRPGASRSETREVLSGFREVEVDHTDIPPYYEPARKEARMPGASVYKYYYVIPMLCVHVVYDGQQRVASVIPTYE